MRSKQGYIFLFSIFSLLICTQSIAGEPSAIEGQIINFELSRHSKLLAEVTTTDAELTPFVSDGCSGGLSVGWHYMAKKTDKLEAIHGSLPPWESCCIKHDTIYHSGALQGDTSSMSFNRRKEADTRLKTCVIETGKTRGEKLLNEYNLTSEELDTVYQTIGELMYKAVRLGGIPCSGLPWRWGFGWPECR